MKVSSIFIASGIAIANSQEQKHHSSSTQPRRRGMESKSSKARRNNDDAYDWLVGDYTASKSNQVLLINGEVPDIPLPPDADQTLEITRLGDDASANIFQATFIQDISGIPMSPFSFVRLVYEAVGSLNPRLQDEITFYTDNLEYLNGTDLDNDDWVQFGQEDVSGTSSLRCSQLSKEKDGSSIVCDVYENEVFAPNPVFPLGVRLEVIASDIWTDTSE